MSLKYLNMINICAFSSMWMAQIVHSETAHCFHFKLFNLFQWLGHCCGATVQWNYYSSTYCTFTYNM